MEALILSCVACVILTAVSYALIWKYPAAAILFPAFLLYGVSCLWLYKVAKRKSVSAGAYTSRLRMPSCSCLALTAFTDIFGLAGGEDSYFLFNILCCADGIAMCRDLIYRIKALFIPKKRQGFRRICGFGTILLLYIVLGALLPFIFQPRVSESTKENFTLSDYYSEESSGERAKVISQNGEALEERIRLISQAEESVILSTFEIDADSSGKMIMAALMEAAERGVKVSLLADGFPYLTAMWGNPCFLALAQMENVEIRIYNSIRPWKPWALMGRLHDKYLIVDELGYILGGRNTYDYFLGEQEGRQNYDWDVLVYNGNPFGASDYAWNKKKILETGVQILEYDGGVSYHGKCFVIDDRLSGIGSFNWDMRSVYIDTELMLVVDSEALNAQLREEMAQYEQDSLTVIDMNTTISPDGMVPQKIGVAKKILYRFLHLFSWTRFIM